MKNEAKLKEAMKIAKTNPNLSIIEIQRKISVGYPLAKWIYETLLNKGLLSTKEKDNG